MVQQDIEAEYLEARTARTRLDVLREAGAVVVSHNGVTRNNRFDYHVVDFVPQLVHVVPVLLQEPIDRR